ncbi:MAG: adenylosuccinate synthase [Deltaproteobacteria bacterium]|nr:adenylosuccinate synthase [Deltaproteobacteria bacterium]
MTVSVVVGTQWGDEGKGKVVDYLSQFADVVVRFQGGDNAGHTVVNYFGTFQLHLVPCGIFNEKTTNIIGTGMVVNPDVLIEEIEMLKKHGFPMDNLKISSKAHILMPYHMNLDAGEENKLEIRKIGTTKRGIGPAYSDKALRINLRFCDLENLDHLSRHIKRVLPKINTLLSYYGLKPEDANDLIDKCSHWKQYFENMIIDATSYLHHSVNNNLNITFEGQLGVMRDIDHGIYPFVTSSHPIASYASVSSGVPMKKFNKVIGVMKAFSSQVGEGYLPTRMEDDFANIIRGDGSLIDDEFGATTGRLRDIGWLSIPEVKYANLINGFNEIIMCKIDKFDNLHNIKLCINYKYNGKVLDIINTDIIDFEKLEPIYENFEGWNKSLQTIKDKSKLPKNALKYIDRIQTLLDVKISYLGVGPHRDNIIEL